MRTYGFTKHMFVANSYIKYPVGTLVHVMLYPNKGMPYFDLFPVENPMDVIFFGNSILSDVVYEIKMSKMLKLVIGDE